MNELVETSVNCPYCGESIDVLLDPNELNQSYIEDCQVCCRPINFSLLTAIDGDITVSVRADNE